MVKTQVKERPRVRTRSQIAKLVEQVPAGDLNEAQELFCKEYVFDYNASRAYAVAYPRKKSVATISVNACRLLSNANIKLRIQYFKEHIEESLGLSKEKIVAEHVKMAFQKSKRYAVKQRSLDSISKMMGYDAPVKTENKNFNVDVSVSLDEAKKILSLLEKNI